MKKIILGATGSIGSSLAKKVIADGGEVHLVGRDESSLSELASELNSTFTTCDVLEENFSDKILSDLGETPINGLAYCVGSIDLKPIKMTKKSDYMQSFNLNLISATEIIGVSNIMIMFKHILPNILRPILVIGTIGLALAIIAESTLSFLGVGVPPTTPSLGTLIRLGNDFLFSGEWWITFFPAIFLVILAFFLNLFCVWMSVSFYLSLIS